MKKVLFVAGLVIFMSGCGRNGSGDANFCDELPASIAGLLVGDSVVSTPELATEFDEKSAVTLELGVATYWFRRYNSTYDYYCWNRVVKVDRVKQSVISVQDQ